jgi:hypothetical protein
LAADGFPISNDWSTFRWANASDQFAYTAPDPGDNVRKIQIADLRTWVPGDSAFPPLLFKATTALNSLQFRPDWSPDDTRLVFDAFDEGKHTNLKSFIRLLDIAPEVNGVPTPGAGVPIRVTRGEAAAWWEGSAP